MAKTPEPKPTIITVEIAPLKDGKRKVVVSGAPEKEMPVMKVGSFAELHHMIDVVWIELQKREPQVVTVKEEKAKTATKPPVKKDDADKADAGPETAETAITETVDEAPDPAEKALDDAGGNVIQDAPDEPEALPEIEGDATAIPATEDANG